MPTQPLYELRVYHLHQDKLPLILARFRGGETDLFARHHIHGVAYFTPTEEPLTGRTLTYMVRHQSREAATQNWAAFQADPEWIAMKAETEKDGPFVISINSTFLALTDFSPTL